MKAYRWSGQLYPLDRRLDGSQSGSGWDGEENILDSTRTLDSLVIQLIASLYPVSLPVLVWGAILNAHLGLVG
jgi:hypothetical protein